MAKKEETATAEGAKRTHKASYAKDKRQGGYLIRVQGPKSNMFVGRTVPVSKKDSTDEDQIELIEIVWSGKDDDTGAPVTLYKFKPKLKEDRDSIPF